MPSQKTICQQCGDLIATDSMPRHVAQHAIGAGLTAAVDDSIGEILGAVCCGATLQIRMRGDGTSTLVATLESLTGARYAISIGEALGPVLAKLARDWQAQQSISAGVAPVEQG